MKLPNFRNVVIPKEKLTDYLLSATHPEGHSKAKAFRRWGFDETNIGELEYAFRKIACTRKIINTIPTPYGKKYVVNGKIQIPRGGGRNVKTIWIVEFNQQNPRFISAYPLK